MNKKSKTDPKTKLAKSEEDVAIRIISQVMSKTLRDINLFFIDPKTKKPIKNKVMSLDDLMQIQKKHMREA